jgi:hypothetical protein
VVLFPFFNNIRWHKTPLRSNFHREGTSLLESLWVKLLQWVSPGIAGRCTKTCATFLMTAIYFRSLSKTGRESLSVGAPGLPLMATLRFTFTLTSIRSQNGVANIICDPTALDAERLLTLWHASSKEIDLRLIALKGRILDSLTPGAAQICCRGRCCAKRWQCLGQPVRDPMCSVEVGRIAGPFHHRLHFADQGREAQNTLGFVLR